MPGSYPVFRLSIRCAPRGATEQHKGKRHDCLRACQRGPLKRLNQKGYERQICAFKPARGGPDRHDPQRKRKPSVSSLAGGILRTRSAAARHCRHLSAVSWMLAARRAPKPQVSLNIPNTGGAEEQSRCSDNTVHQAENEVIASWVTPNVDR